MGEVLINLLPVIVGAALVPLYPIVVLLLLQSEGGLRKAVAFVAGGVGVRLAQGLLFGAILGAAADEHTEDETQLIVSTLLLVVSVLLLVTAYRYWRKEGDPDAPPPQWMASLGGLSAVKAVGAGALYVVIAFKQWVFTLSALSIIFEGYLGNAANITLYLVYLLATQILVLPILLAYAVAPQRAAGPLQAAHGWLARNNRVIVMIVSLIFGVWFMYKSISGLL